MTQAVTYKTEDPQAVFDFVVQKLFEQGGKARNELTCMYRAESGRKCALGWLIPDEEYNPEMECRTLIEDTGTLSGEYKGLVVTHNVRLIRALQRAHDDASAINEITSSWAFGTNRGEWISNMLRDVATGFELDPSIVDKCWPAETNGSHP